MNAAPIEFAKDYYAKYGDVVGQITRDAKTIMPGGMMTNREFIVRNVWWKPLNGDTETMFSRRADGAWRPFPGAANAPGLVPTMKPVGS